MRFCRIQTITKRALRLETNINEDMEMIKREIHRYFLYVTKFVEIHKIKLLNPILTITSITFEPQKVILKQCN